MGATTVSTLEVGDEHRWDEFVDAHPDGTVFHRAAWRGVISTAFGHESHFLVARSGDRIEGVLPLVRFSNRLFGRYLVSMPFLNGGGVLAASTAACDALLGELPRLVADTRSEWCELRSEHAVGHGLVTRVSKVTMRLDVSGGVDAVWNGLRPKVRTLVRKAERAGLVARAGVGDRDLSAFYRVFAENVRNLGTPVYTPRFFEAVFRAFPERSDLVLVERDGVIAAAGICLHHGAVTEFHWMGSRRAMLPLAPNMLLYWEMMRLAMRRGSATFSMGRSTPDSGPYRFKVQWGAVATELPWQYLIPPGGRLPDLQVNNPRFALAVRAWKRLPLPVARVLGPPIVRHIP